MKQKLCAIDEEKYMQISRREKVLVKIKTTIDGESHEVYNHVW